MRCRACDSLIDFRIDEELCPKCFSEYVENLDDITPEDQKKDINKYINKISRDKNE